MKVKVYLWTNDVKVIPMQSGDVTGKPLDSIENVSNVMSAMLPSGDLEAMCEALVSAVRISVDLNESNTALANRLYRELVRHSTFNK